MSTASQQTAFTPITFVTPTSESEPTRRRWTRGDYYVLDEQGWFQDQRVELIDGEIILLSPQSPQHAYGSDAVRRLLERAFGDGYWVRPNFPLTHGEYSEPEPDISVVRGPRQEFAHAHPTSALLVVEVSRTTLRYDKHTKKHLYASMGVSDYWILDLINRQLIVHREPHGHETAPFGSDYASIAATGDIDSVSPLAKPDVVLAVAEMLPPR